MTEYKKEFPFPVIFPPTVPKNSLAEWLSLKGLKQFHCAETEKYAHVTFFFNGGLEKAFEGEERCMVPSPKVPTYDLKPEMSAEGVGEAVSTCTMIVPVHAYVTEYGNREERMGGGVEEKLYNELFFNHLFIHTSLSLSLLDG